MEDLSLFSRREFLRGVGAFGAASLGLWAGGCEHFAEDLANRPVRRNISNLSPSDPIIQTFKAAVSLMKGLPLSDRRNWSNLADIHFNYCLHANWLWLPWHRVYLWYFERICQKLTGDSSFALPYWNWTTHPSIPDVFWDTTSPLYDGTRAVNQSDQANPAWVSAAVIESILSETNFEQFASGALLPGDDPHFGAGHATPLEANTHNSIHSWIGGNMGGFHSPLDPVFWMHHNMLDCLWVDWNVNRNNPNTNDPNWGDFQFTDFVDENGNPVTLQTPFTAAVVMPLTYQFEPCTPIETASKMGRRQLEQFLRAGAPSKLEFTNRFELRQTVTAEVGKPATVAIKVQPDAFRPVLAAGGKNLVVLTVGDVDIPQKRDYFVRVFLDKPDVSAQTSIDDPHYAGSFAFFFDEAPMKRHEGMAGRPKAGYLIDVTPTLRRLSRAGSLSSAKVDVSFVPVPYAHRETAGRLTLGRLELGIARF